MTDTWLSKVSGAGADISPSQTLAIFLPYIMLSCALHESIQLSSLYCHIASIRKGEAAFAAIALLTTPHCVDVRTVL